MSTTDANDCEYGENIELYSADEISLEEMDEIQRSSETKMADIRVIEQNGSALVRFDRGIPRDLMERATEMTDKRRRGDVATIWWREDEERAVLSHVPVYVST